MSEHPTDIRVCAVHQDTLDVLEAIKVEMMKSNIETAKLINSLGWIKKLMTGLLGIAVTVLLAVIPFIANLHARVMVLERIVVREKLANETSYGRSITSLDYPSEQRIVRDSKELAK